jgi:Tfp pilus assembly protein PilF
VSRRHVFTSSSDIEREIPKSEADRQDRIAVAIATLRAEEHRLARLGLDEAARHCRQQLRYWEFLSAVFSLPADERGDREAA